MAKQIAKLLKTDVMADIDMPGIAQFLQSQGRRGDSILAHINPKEAMLLQSMGGAATSNPVTGLPEFYQEDFEPVDINDLVTESRFERLRNPPPVSSYQETEPSTNIFRQDYSQPLQATRVDDTFSQPSSTRYSRKTNFRGSGEFEQNQQPAPDVRLYPDVNFGYIPEFRGIQDTTLDRFNVPNVAKGFDEAGFPTLPGAQGQDQSQQQPPSDGRNVFRRGADYLKETTGLSGNELARLGLAAGLGIQGALGSRDAAEQGRRARAEQEEIARPYRERGAELLAQAEGGQLTPQGQQSLQAMRARLAQGVEARGGVGAQQAQAQIENYRQQLIANQYDYGMKISNVGDQLMLGAIRTGLEADRYATQMTNNYYTNMARILVGMGTNENELKQITQSGNGGQ